MWKNDFRFIAIRDVNWPFELPQVGFRGGAIFATIWA